MVELKHKLPEEFFKEETRYGHFISREVKELWAVELDLLYELDRVCKKHDLKYFLAFGTLIGAVRDGHFIPWDDDIDVVMLRRDYNILVRELRDEFQHPYFLQTGYNDEDYYRGHAQLRNSETCGALPLELLRVPFNQGIFLDIFVLDEIPSDEKELDSLFRFKVNMLRKRTVLRSTKDPSVLKHVGKILFKIWIKMSKASLETYKEFDDRFGAERGTDYVDVLMFRTRLEQIRYLKKEWFQDSILVDFEDGQFPAPAQFDGFLRAYYGEYMTPRHEPNGHDIFGDIIVDVNRSYKDVIRDSKDQ